MKDASILGNLRGMLVDEIHGLRYIINYTKLISFIQQTIYAIFTKNLLLDTWLQNF